MFIRLRTWPVCQCGFIGLAVILQLTACAGHAVHPAMPPATNGQLAAVLAELEAAPTPIGVDEQVFAQMKAALRAQLLAKGALKTACTPPLDDASGAAVAFDYGADVLSWRYHCTGDYDQNGEVNISDLTPLGLHFGESGDFTEEQAASVVDGDGNGEINIGDITPIGQNFGVTVSGYNAYASLDPADIPLLNGDPNGPGARSIGAIPLSAALGDKAQERLSFSLNVAAPVAGEVYWVRPTDGSSEGTPVERPENSRVLLPGGSVQLGQIKISVPEDCLLEPIRVDVTPIPPPPGPPEGFTPLGQAWDINVSNPELLNAPLIIILPYNDAGVPDEQLVTVLHYSAAAEYEPVTLLDVDIAANTVTFDSRVFSPFILGFIDPLNLAALPASADLGFDVQENGWDIANFGSYFSAGGNCLGMSAYCAWFFSHEVATLWGHFDSSAGEPTSIAHLTATRAHLAQSQFWAAGFHDYESKLGPDVTGKLLQYYLHEFRQPMIFKMNGPFGGHATVVYGYDATGFQFYDVNYPGLVQTINWDTTSGFGAYEDFFAFSFIAEPSLGRTEDFADLTSEAEGGFTRSADIQLTAPASGAQIAGHETALEGSLSGSLSSEAVLLCYVKGLPIVIPAGGGTFSATIPVSNGKNTLVLLAGVDRSKQSMWFKNGATLVREVTGQAGISNLLVTLSWQQDASDVDLYVIEPGGDTAWYDDLSTVNGLDLDIDNTLGFGPEHVTLSTAEGDSVQAGPYHVWVHYYRDRGEDRPSGPTGPVNGTVSILVNEGTPEQTFSVTPFKINTANPNNDAPGSSGPDWFKIASVEVVKPAGP